MKLTVEVLTPQTQIYSGEADEILVPTVSGQLGILPGHVALLTKIEPGELEIKNGGKSVYVAIMGGYLEVSKDKVNVLGDYAIRAENIEVIKVEQAKAKAEKLKAENQEMKAENSLLKEYLCSKDSAPFCP